MQKGPGAAGSSIRVAAAADVHCHEGNRAEVTAAFRGLDDEVDLVLLAGDLTTHGEPQQAAVLADACRSLEVPIYAVLGNHDHHAGAAGRVVEVLVEAGIRVLERSSAICRLGGTEVGIVGVKGFVGGFPGSHIPDFGEPLMREIYAETSREVEALERGLREIAHCPFRVVLLHYSPTDHTLEGERRDIWAVLGTDRMAAPIVEHGPDLALHGHAHAGRFEGRVGDTPVYNVSVPVMGQDFWRFELSTPRRPTTPIH